MTQYNVSHNGAGAASPLETLMSKRIIEWFGKKGEGKIKLNGVEYSCKEFFGFDTSELSDVKKIMSIEKDDGEMSPLKGFLMVFFKWMERVDAAYLDVLERHREMFYRDGLGLAVRVHDNGRMETREEYLFRCAVRLSYKEQLLIADDFKVFFKTNFPEIHSIELREESFVSGVREVCIYVMPKVKDEKFKYENVFSDDAKGIPENEKLSAAKLEKIKDVLSMHCSPRLHFSVKNVPALSKLK